MIVVAGEALIDRVVSADDRVQEASGGGPFNVVRTIARLGGTAAFLGRLSTDERGRGLRAALADDGVDLSWADPTDDPTTLATATIDAAGDATYAFDLAGTSSADLSPMTARAALDAGPAAVHIGTLALVMEPVGSALETAIATLTDDTLFVLDPNCRPTAVADRAAYLARIRALTRRADIVKVSADDLAYLAPGESADGAARDLLSRGARVVLLTDGGGTVRILSADFESVVPVPPTRVVDTIGAGDSFGGGFVARWIGRGRGRTDLRDRSALEDATRYGILVAGITCGRAGADPPTAADLAGLGPSAI